MSLDERCKQLQEEYQKDLELLRQLEEEIYVLHHQITKQSEFSYRMGSVLSDYLKKASEDPANVAAMVADPSFKNLVELAKETIIKVSRRGLTKKSEEDSLFILSLLGVFANIAKVEEGKEYMREPHFQETIYLFIKLLLTQVTEVEDDKVEACSFKDYVKLHTMEMLNALSEKPEAAAQLGSQKEVYSAIMMAVCTESWNPIRKPALQLLHRLLSSITDENIFAIAKKKLAPLDYIGNLQMSTDVEIKTAAEAAITSLHQAESRFQDSEIEVVTIDEEI